MDVVRAEKQAAAARGDGAAAAAYADELNEMWALLTRLKSQPQGASDGLNSKARQVAALVATAEKEEQASAAAAVSAAAVRSEASTAESELAALETLLRREQAAAETASQGAAAEQGSNDMRAAMEAALAKS